MADNVSMAVCNGRCNRYLNIKYIVFISLLIACAFYFMTIPGRNRTDSESARKESIILLNNQHFCGNHSVGYTPESVVRHTGKRNNRRVNQFLSEYDSDIRSRLQTVISNGVSSRDPSVVSLVRDLMDPPSKHMIKTVRQIVETPQSKEALAILKGKRRGFFVEVGGLDGERSSNTLFLEQRLGWTGLLIEMDPYFYTQLLGKSRRCWSINACISPYDCPIEMSFKESSGGGGQLVEPGGPTKAASPKVPCFPLESMLLALNTTHVDYFSLDVEGYELEVLRTIPFDRIDIRVLSVEYVHGHSGKQEYKTYMEAHGYNTHRDLVHTEPKIALYVNDFIFVKADN